MYEATETETIIDHEPLRNHELESVEPSEPVQLGIIKDRIEAERKAKGRPGRPGRLRGTELLEHLEYKKQELVRKHQEAEAKFRQDLAELEVKIREAKDRYAEDLAAAELASQRRPEEIDREIEEFEKKLRLLKLARKKG